MLQNNGQVNEWMRVRTKQKQYGVGSYETMNKNKVNESIKRIAQEDTATTTHEAGVAAAVIVHLR